jgi:hypothetical protein
MAPGTGQTILQGFYCVLVSNFVSLQINFTMFWARLYAAANIG